MRFVGGELSATRAVRLPPSKSLLIIEDLRLTGASLDKAGAIHPQKRVGIIQWGWG